MADEIDFENGRISSFQRHVTLTLTLDRAISHTVVHLAISGIFRVGRPINLSFPQRDRAHH